MKKPCEFCGKYEAAHLTPIENGPIFGLTLGDGGLGGSSRGSDRYCSHECWESDIKVQELAADD
jgi:hypothetical protein